MLRITIPATEQWDAQKQEFVYTKEQTLQLEHSLVSLSKWESKYHRPFLSNKAKTVAETIDYICCMTLTQNVKPEVYLNVTNQNIADVERYIQDPMTATWFGGGKGNKGSSREVITAEIIYYWMISLNIPFECQKWHLNRLLTLIRVCSEKNAPKKKMSRRQILARNKALNEARRNKLHTKG